VAQVFDERPTPPSAPSHDPIRASIESGVDPEDVDVLFDMTPTGKRTTGAEEGPP